MKPISRYQLLSILYFIEHMSRFIHYRSTMAWHDLEMPIVDHLSLDPRNRNNNVEFCPSAERLAAKGCKRYARKEVDRLRKAHKLSRRTCGTTTNMGDAPR